MSIDTHNRAGWQDQFYGASRKCLIFTVTTGRSGTGLLQKLFSLLSDTTALHEPAPKFSDLRRVQADPNYPREFWLDLKLPAICTAVGRIYVETSHLFCKGFLEPLIELKIVPDIVILRRSPREVARSLYELNTVPVRTPLGQWNLLSPEDPGVLELPGWEELHDYQLCYWYCLEIERRARIYASRVRCSGGRVVETSLAGLISRDFLRVVRELGLEANMNGDFETDVLQLVQDPVNDKKELKRQIGRTLLPTHLDELERVVLERSGISARPENWSANG